MSSGSNKLLRKSLSNPGLSVDTQINADTSPLITPVDSSSNRNGIIRQASHDDALYADAASEAPSTPQWRAARLHNIGASNSDSNINDENQQLMKSHIRKSYGATDASSASRVSRRIQRRGSPSLPSWANLRRDSFVRFGERNGSPDRMSIFRSLRGQPSAYDSPYAKRLRDGDDHRAEKINGIRVWYSSFQSIDWLHDAIKDVSRLRRLRRRRDVRGRLRAVADRFSGWLVVSVVGFLTAVVAFLIARSERWLFDLKEGHCKAGWYHTIEACTDWETWDELFDPRPDDERSWIGSAHWIIEYLSYIVVALFLAGLSSVLTIYLTASSTFVTHKDSGILSSSSSSKSSQFEAAPVQRRIMHYAAGSGIPEIKTILSGFVIHGYLGARTLFTKSVGLTLSVASGLSLGKEGPMVHIASCIGNIISRFFTKYENNEGKRREILSAASAAGVAVAFGAPVGGVLFSLEEVSYFFPSKVMWRSFFCAMIAVMTLKLLDPFGTGKLVLFQVTYDKDWHTFELIFFLILGLFGGIYGAYFSKLNYRWSKHVRNGTWLKTHPISEVLMVTTVTALLSFLNPYTRMGGTELVYNLFSECRQGESHGGLCVHPNEDGQLAQNIAIALIVKGVLTIVTFGIKVPAGIFIPTLGVGACFGRILGLAVQRLQQAHPDLGLFNACNGDAGCVVPGLYAMVGAAATLSGVTVGLFGQRTTVSLAVIMFELTDTLTYTVPVMLAILVAKTVADALEPKGIYDLVIELAQLPYLDAKHQHLWGGLQLEDVIDRHVEVIRADELNSVEHLRDQLQRAVSSGENDDGFPVVQEDEENRLKLVGHMGLNELEHALSLVADHATGLVHFRSAASGQLAGSVSSSLFDAPSGPDPLDFTVFMDQAPLTVQAHSPLELVQQFFVKLGARYIIATRADGTYQGVISKKHWLAFLSELHV